ncbi:MAG: sulfurtransferase complex subunit TusB [Thioalkalispiraceae bacterium]
MSMLHTVNKSSYDRNTLETCVSLASKGSEVILIEDGVYSAVKTGNKAGVISDAMGDVNFYVLGPDLKARGLNEGQLIDGIKVVDYSGFVELSVKNDKVTSWL